MNRIRSLILKDLFIISKQLKNNLVFWAIFSALGFLISLSIVKGNLAVLYQTEEALRDAELLVVTMEFASAAILSVLFVHPAYEYSPKWTAFEFASPVSAHEHTVAKLLSSVLILAVSLPVSVIYARLVTSLWPVGLSISHTAGIACIVCLISALNTLCGIVSEFFRSRQAPMIFITVVSICGSLALISCMWMFEEVTEETSGIDLLRILPLDILYKILLPASVTLIIAGYFIIKKLYARRKNKC